MRAALTFCFGVSYLANAFAQSPVLADVNLVLMIAVVVLSFIAARGSSLVIGGVLCVLGIAMLAYAQAPLETWKQALQENAYLIVLFIMVPLLGIPVQHGGYSDSLRGVFARYAGTGGRFYASVSVMTAALGTLVSIAALPLTYEVARVSPHSKDGQLLSAALSRGFITCMIWAPTSATIALVVQLTGIDWVGFFPLALVCAVIAGVIGFLMTGLRMRGMRDAFPPQEASVQPFNVSKLVELALFAGALIVVIVAISALCGLSVIMVVSLVSLAFPVAWMAVIGRLPCYVREFKGSYWTRKLPQVKNQIVLFTGAGVFAAGISSSHVGDALAGALLTLTGQNVALLTAVIIAVALAASVVGVHPVAVVGAAIGSAECGMSPIYLALVLSISWAMANAICPASANVIAVADMVGRSPLTVSLRWNAPYALVSTVVLVGVLTLFRATGLA